MKKLKNLIMVGALAGLLFSPALSEAGARIYIRFGPPRLKTVKVVRPLKPYRNAVWISGHWSYHKGRYVWVNGYWVKARHNYIYVPARWKKSPHGWYFVPGRWAKR
jgi:hypothetical protein